MRPASGVGAETGVCAMRGTLDAFSAFVRHTSDVERVWFGIRFAAIQPADVLIGESNANGAFNDTDDTDPEQVFATFLREGDLARAAARDRDLSETSVHTRSKRTMNLRCMYVHMIEEHARQWPCGPAARTTRRDDGA
jgi:hypothetical protein